MPSWVFWPVQDDGKLNVQPPVLKMPWTIVSVVKLGMQSGATLNELYDFKMLFIMTLN